MMSKKSGLGKGLRALMPTEIEQPTPAGNLPLIPLTAITPNPHQPRSQFNEQALAELAASIREHGLIQPLLVHRQEEGQYILIAGERRWRAAQQAGLTEVPAIIKEATPQAMLEIALIENIQRADLNPLEEATAYRQLMDEFGLTQEKVADRVGKSRPEVANTLRLLHLPTNIQQAVLDGKLSGSHARTLLPLPTPEAQNGMLQTILKNGLSVRQTEEAVSKILAGEKPRSRPVAKPLPELTALETKFRQALGTRVILKKWANGNGQVIIHFYSDEELHSIYEAIIHED